MPHSLRAKLSGLRYKKIISEKDYDRLCKALDNEGALDKIRAEIMAIGNWTTKGELPNGDLIKALEIIDKYKAESEAVVFDK